MRIVAVQVLLKSVAIVKGLVDCYRRDWSYHGVWVVHAWGVGVRGEDARAEAKVLSTAKV